MRDNTVGTMTSLELWHRVHEHVRAYDMEQVASYYAEDAVLEFPFAPPGMPSRLEGREAIRAALVRAGEASRAAAGGSSDTAQLGRTRRPIRQS
jgi:ketosteroid isomerase-like protein